MIRKISTDISGQFAKRANNVNRSNRRNIEKCCFALIACLFLPRGIHIWRMGLNIIFSFAVHLDGFLKSCPSSKWQGKRLFCKIPNPALEEFGLFVQLKTNLPLKKNGFKNAPSQKATHPCPPPTGGWTMHFKTKSYTQSVIASTLRGILHNFPHPDPPQLAILPTTSSIVPLSILAMFISSEK